MRRWLKYVCPIVIAIAALIFFFFRNQKECSVCNSFRYHAPCLIDLDEGKILELDLYFPHETKVAELADEQPEMGTWTTAILLTTPRRASTMPMAEKAKQTTTPELLSCLKKCSLPLPRVKVSPSN